MTNRFREARELMRDTLSKDKGLYVGYQSNIATLLHDEQDKRSDDSPIDYTNYDNRNNMAKLIISLIFSK